MERKAITKFLYDKEFLWTILIISHDKNEQKPLIEKKIIFSLSMAILFCFLLSFYLKRRYFGTNS
jgi:hypothetical protein